MLYERGRTYSGISGDRSPFHLSDPYVLSWSYANSTSLVAIRLNFLGEWYLATILHDSATPVQLEKNLSTQKNSTSVDHYTFTHPTNLFWGTSICVGKLWSPSLLVLEAASIWHTFFGAGFHIKINFGLHFLRLVCFGFMAFQTFNPVFTCILRYDL